MRERAGAAGPDRTGAAEAAAARTPGDEVMALHCAAGNHAVHALLAAPDHGGAALDPAIRTAMESSFGTSFGDVVVHTGAAAADSAQSLGASAYTVGPDVVFGEGQFAPGTAPGRMLIAHELAHVVQQRHGGRPSGADHEAEADRAALDVGLGQQPAPVASPAAVGVALAELGFMDRARALSDRAKAKGAALAQQALQTARDVQERAKTWVADTSATAQATVATATTQVAAAAPVQKAAAAVRAAVPKISPKAKAKARDAVKGYLGTVEGVYLEAGNIVDTGLWALTKVGDAEDAVFGSLDGVATKAGLTPTQRSILVGTARGTAVVVSGGTFGMVGPGVKVLRDAAQRTEVDPLTGQPIGIDITGAPAVSGFIGKAFGGVEGAIDKSGVFDGAEPDTGVLTARDLGQITGSVGSQAALGVVGAEEAVLALKVIGGIGAARSIDVAYHRNKKEGDPYAPFKTAEFWFAVGNLALFVIGLRQSSAGRKLLTLFVDVAQAALAATPPLVKLADDLSNPDLPNREAVLRDDYKAVATAAGNVLLQIVTHHARGGGKGGAKGGPEEPLGGARPGAAEHAEAGGTGAAKPTGEPGAAKPAGAELGGTGPQRAPGAAEAEPPTVIVKAADPKAPAAPDAPKPDLGYREMEPRPPEFPHPEPRPAPAPPPPAPAPAPPAPEPVVHPGERKRIDPTPFKEAPAPPQPDRFEIHPRFVRKPKSSKAAAEPPATPAEPAPLGPYRTPAPKPEPRFPDPAPRPAPAVPTPTPQVPTAPPEPAVYPDQRRRRDPAPFKEAPPARPEIDPRFTRKPPKVRTKDLPLKPIVMGTEGAANDNAHPAAAAGLRTGTDDLPTEARPPLVALPGGQAAEPVAVVASAGGNRPSTPVQPQAPSRTADGWQGGRTPAAPPPRRPPPDRLPGATAEGAGKAVRHKIHRSTPTPEVHVRPGIRRHAEEAPQPQPPAAHHGIEDLDPPPIPYDTSQAHDPSTWYGQPEHDFDTPHTPPAGPNPTRSLFDDPETGKPAVVRKPRSEPEPDATANDRPTPGGKKVSIRTEGGLFTHQYAEALKHTAVGRPKIPPEFAGNPKVILLSDMPDGLLRELRLGALMRADRVQITDPSTGMVYEIKPNTVASIEKGLQQQGPQYSALLKGEYQLDQTDFRVAVYDQKAALAYVEEPGTPVNKP